MTTDTDYEVRQEILHQIEKADSQLKEINRLVNDHLPHGAPGRTVALIDISLALSQLKFVRAEIGRPS